MNKVSKTWVIALVLLLASGGALAQNTTPAAPTGSAAKLTENELIYYVLLAELAARRGQFERALTNYAIAARGSNDSRLLERAAGIALYINDDAQTLELARRWLELAPADSRAHQAAALALLRGGQVGNALEHLEAVRAQAQQDGQEGFATLSGLFSQVRDRAVVLQALQKLRERHPQSRYALYYLALTAFSAEQYPAALEGLQAALALDPRWREALLLRAQVKLRQGEPEAALAELAEAVADQPDERDLRFGYARLLVIADKLEQARAEFTRLAQQDPDDAEALYALGLLAAEAEQYDIARDYLQRVLALGKRLQDVYFELGKIEEQGKNYPQARGWYEKVTEGERYLSAQIRAAAMLARAGDIVAMGERLTVLRQENPDDAIALYISEADILREEKFYQAGFDKLSEGLKAFPSDRELLYARALAAEKIDLLDVLEADLRAIIDADPDNGHALNALGYTLADRTDRYQEALGYLERAVKLLPEDAAVLDSMGWVNYRLGQYAEALDFLRRAYALNPDPEIVAHLSEVLWVSNQHQEARQVWHKAFAEHPDSEHLLRIKERFALDD